MEQSEFGSGLTYCLGLFLAHAERPRMLPDGSAMEAELWFNAASDHLYDLVIPEDFPALLKEALSAFKNECLHLGHGFNEPTATMDDVKRLIQAAKDLLRMIDIHFGIPVVQGAYE